MSTRVQMSSITKSKEDLSTRRLEKGDEIGNSEDANLDYRDHPKGFIKHQCLHCQNICSRSIALGTSIGGSSNGCVYGCVSTLKGHDSSVFSMVLAGDLLYTGSIGKDIRVWRHADHETVLDQFSIFGCKGSGAIKSIVVAKGKIFTAHQDHKIRIWRRSQSNQTIHKLVSTMPTLKNYMSIFINPKSYVRVRRHKKALWIQHFDTISALAVDKTGSNLYSASWDRTVKVWNLSDFRCLESFKAHDDAINALVVSTDEFVYTASADCNVKVWKKHDGQKKHSLVTVLDSHKSAVNALALTPDCSILYSGCCDSSIFVWDLNKMCVASIMQGHRHAILCLTTVSRFVCSGSADKTIRVWERVEDSNLHSCIAILDGHSGPVKCITARMDDNSLNCIIHSGSLDREIKVWCVTPTSPDWGHKQMDNVS